MMTWTACESWPVWPWKRAELPLIPSSGWTELGRKRHPSRRHETRDESGEQQRAAAHGLNGSRASVAVKEPERHVALCAAHSARTIAPTDDCHGAERLDAADSPVERVSASEPRERERRQRAADESAEVSAERDPGDGR